MKPFFHEDGMTIYLGDVIEVLSSMPAISGKVFGFTDPPYNVGIDYGHGIDDRKAAEIYRRWCGHWMELFRSHCHAMAVYTPAKHTRMFWEILSDDFRQIVLTWGPLGPVRDGIINQHATILHNAKFSGNKSSGVRDVWNNLPSKRMGYAFHEVDYGHPGFTSEGITRKCIGSLAHDSDVVIDPFMGTGTSLIVAKERNKQGVGIEKSERWAELAARRLQQCTPAMI
jgi:DNA modification methylase